MRELERTIRELEATRRAPIAPPGRVRKWRRWMLAGAIVLIAVSIALAARVATASEVAHLAAFIRQASPLDVRACTCGPDRDVEFTRADGLKIAGSLYGTSGEDQPGILLLHGNTPLGRRMPLYRVLAREFADRGYTVLALDLAGYGDSADPFSLGTADALEPGRDVEAGIAFLRAQQGVDPEKLYIVAHSAGAVTGLQVGFASSQVKAVAAIGPPRRVAERMQDPADQEYFWQRAKRTRREVYGLDFPAWYTKDTFVKGSLDGALEQHLPYLSTEGHRPLMLLDGALEDEADRTYLRHYYEAIAGPKAYHTVPSSDHYANTIGLAGRVLYDRQAVTDTAGAIDLWLKRLP